MKILLAFISLFLSLILPPNAYAAQPTENKDAFLMGIIIEITDKKIKTVNKMEIFSEKLKVQLLEGKEKGKIVMVKYGGRSLAQQLDVGDKIIVNGRYDAPIKQTDYWVTAPYRLTNFWWILAGFALLIIGVAGKKGLRALIGLIISIATIAFYIVPNLALGQDPIVICLIGALIILFLTTYIAHGISMKTTVAIIGTGISLLFATWLATSFVHLLNLYGFGSEDAQNVLISTSLDARGLLLGGILIGTLGALNDITTTQSIAIFTLAKEQPHQKISKLFYFGMTIGKEHVASLVNTLVLAYAGTAIIIFISLALYAKNIPWWVILNGEPAMEEILRTIVGSAALIIAVPITSFLAAYISLKKNKIKPS